MNSRHFVLNTLLFIDICLYLRFQACDILKLSVTITFFGLGPDYMRRGGPVNRLPRKTGQPTSIVCCLLIRN